MTALLAKAIVIAIIIHAPCPGHEARDGCAMRPNIVYLSPGLDLPWEGRARRWAAAHELGHIVDYNFLTNADRGMFEALTHQHRAWERGPNAPQEQFAEAVTTCERSMYWPPSVGGAYEYHPAVFEHRKICRWLATIGARP